MSAAPVPADPKAAERDYYRNIGEAGRLHALRKPFSDPAAGALLMEMAAALSLLPPPPGRILDCGCGTGWTTCLLARRGYQVVGQDIAADAIALAERNKAEWNTPDVQFVVSDFESLGYTNEFDGILFFAALHHTQDLEASLRAAHRALKPGGVVVCIEPGKGHAKRAALIEGTHGVTDQDLPPTLLRDVGQRVGFSAVRVYPHAGQLDSVLYSARPRNPRYRWFFRWGVVRYLALFATFLWFKRDNGITVLVK